MTAPIPFIERTVAQHVNAIVDAIRTELEHYEGSRNIRHEVSTNIMMQFDLEEDHPDGGITYPFWLSLLVDGLGKQMGILK